jgi:hypothetical protein
MRNAGGNFYLATSSPSTFATSTTPALTIDNNGNIGVATSSPFARFAVQGLLAADSFYAYATTSTTTLLGGLSVNSGALNHDWNTGLTSIDNLQLGSLNFDTDAGKISWVDMPVTSNSTAGTVESYTAQLDGLPMLTVYAESDGNGGIRSPRISIATTTPYATLTVWGTSTDPMLANFVSNASTSIFTILNSGNVGINTKTPNFTFEVSGTASTTKLFATFSTTTNATTTNLSTTNASTTNLFVSSAGGTPGCATFSSTGLISNTSVACGGAGSNPDTKFATTSGTLDPLAIYPNGGINTLVGIGTTTPHWSLQIASSTGPQLALTDGISNNGWTMRNAGGLFYLATSSPSTYATSTASVFSIDVNGIPTFSSLGGQIGCAQLSATGLMSNTGTACGSGGGSPDTKFATSTGAYLGITPNSGTLVNLGIGTTTPVWSITVSSSTGPQLALTDASLTSNIWTMRNAGGNFYLATSSPSTYATSTTAAISIVGTSGLVGIGTNVPGAKLEIKSSAEQLRLSNPSVSSYVGFAVNEFNHLTVTNTEPTGQLIFKAANTDAARLLLSSTFSSITAPTNINLFIDADNNDSTSAFNFYKNDTYESGNQISLMRVQSDGKVGIGTSTPKWALQVASSTGPQLTLSDGLPADNHWSFRNAGGLFYLATSSPSTFATSTASVFSIDANGIPTFSSLGGQIGCAQFSATGLMSNTGTACGSGGGSNTDKFATTTGTLDPNAIYLNGGVNTLLGIGTTTPHWSLQIASSTGPQLALTDGISNNGWTMRNAGGNFYLASSSPSTFATSTYAAFTVKSTNGFVGMGTAAPSDSLHVSGTVTNGSVNLRIQNTAATNASAGLLLSSTGFSDWDVTHTGNGSGELSFRYNGNSMGKISNTGNATFGSSISLGASTLNAKGSLSLGSTYYLIAAPADGAIIESNVGIGTSTPKWALQVASSTAPQLTLSDGLPADNHWSFRNAGGYLYFATSSPSTYGTSTATALTIDRNGNVGIGAANSNVGIGTSTSLTSKLSVSNGFISLYNSSNVEALRFDPSDTGGHSEGNIGGALISPTANNGNLIISSTVSGSGGTVQMSNFTGAWLSMLEYTSGSKNLLLVKSGGNVGIGTSTPKWALQVASSTAPQLTLTGGIADNHWSFRNAGGNLYIGTSSPSTFGTSSTPAISIISGGLAGKVGIASSTPWGGFSLELDANNPALVVANQGSTSPALYIGSVNQNGFIGMGTTTITSLARLVMDNTISSADGSQVAIAGVNQMYTFNPTVGNTTQVGNRLTVLNSPSGGTATNTAVAQIIRMVDNTVTSNLVRGIEVVASAGNNTYGVNTGIRSTGHTFGIQGLTDGQAGGTSTPAAIYGENTGTTQGDILRLYTSTMTTATSIATFYQETSTFSGTGLYMNFGAGTGVFNGKFVDFTVNGNSRFSVASSGTTTIGQANQTIVTAGLLIPYGSICVDNDGTCNGTTTGVVAANGFQTGHTNDIAEYYYSYDALAQGDLVSAKGGSSVAKAGVGNQAIIGVVSTKPGFELGNELSPPSGASKYPIGLAGRIPVRLSTENGPIAIGDRIVLSSIDGVGMKEDPTKPGTVVGVALEPFDGSVGLSNGTIEVQTQRQVVGITCTTSTVQPNTKVQGGVDSEGAVSKPASGPTDVTTCTNQYGDVVPNPGVGQDATTPAGKAVKLGQSLIFISLERTALTASGGSMNNMTSDLSLENNSLLNVKAIASASGKWSIDAGGNLVVETIHAQKGYFDQNIEVGTPAKPTGITLYDSVTGLPYCMRMVAGAISSSQGVCSASAPTSPAQTSSESLGGGQTTSTSGTGGIPVSTTTPPTDTSTSSSTPPADTTPPPTDTSPPIDSTTTSPTPPPDLSVQNSSGSLGGQASPPPDTTTSAELPPSI